MECFRGQCDSCPAHDGNRPPTWCLIFNGELAVLKAQEEYFKALTEQVRKGENPPVIK